ncbi:MAG: hypothetical protein GX845_00485 [Erysipelothrix sp.]|jgi:hypothetical protein|nr:hypothetical protein [Erysipelothrix sp.]
MKKIVAGVVIAGAALIAMMLKRKNKEDEEPILITLEEDQDEPIEITMDQEYSLITIFERQTWQSRIKILLKQLVDQKQLKLVHSMQFASQAKLFDGVREFKQYDYLLVEADEHHQVVIEKEVENFYDDICKEVLNIAQITRSHEGVYREFEIKG